jgi:transposase
LQAKGIACDVIAPALIPRRAGNRVKTDRRDAAQLAVLFRAGALTAIHIPTEQEEAVRDLLRCREDICTDLLRAKHRLSKFLLRRGRRCPDGRAWSKR